MLLSMSLHAHMNTFLLLHCPLSHCFITTVLPIHHSASYVVALFTHSHQHIDLLDLFTYLLDLLDSVDVHLVFHVNCLKELMSSNINAVTIKDL